MSINTVWQQIKQYEKEFSRIPDSVQLIAVSKRQSIDAIRDVYQLGQKHFAENILQEALPKISACNDLALVWHFIGHIQTNKTAAIAKHFAWVHSVDREKVANRLAEQRPQDMPDLNICIQINLDEETNKSGIALTELEAFAEKIKDLPRIKLRGLMAVPKPRHDFDEQRKPFRKLNEAMILLNNKGYALDTLSMGMTQDFKAAIAEGATMVRVGTAVFGARQ